MLLIGRSVVRHNWTHEHAGATTRNTAGHIILTCTGCIRVVAEIGAIRPITVRILAICIIVAIAINVVIREKDFLGMKFSAVRLGMKFKFRRRLIFAYPTPAMSNYHYATLEISGYAYLHMCTGYTNFI